jgi:hypothetical protein
MRARMEPHITFEPRHGYQAGREQAEDDDDRAADQVGLIEVRAQKPAQGRRAGPEQDEDGREPEHEADAEAECPARLLEACFGGKTIRADRAPGDIGDVARHERQHARG